MLEAWQYGVIEAGNGAEVIELTKEFRPRLIFADMLLPVLDGLAATRRIREFSSIRTAIIIFLSVYKDWEMRDVAILAGCDDCLVKPFSEISLKTTIDKYTGSNLPKDLN